MANSKVYFAAWQQPGDDQLSPRRPERTLAYGFSKDKSLINIILVILLLLLLLLWSVAIAFFCYLAEYRIMHCIIWPSTNWIWILQTALSSCVL